MGEENTRIGLSWLGLKEVNNFLSDTELNIGERNVLKRKRGFLLEQMRQEALHSESPRDTINVILKISDEQELDVGMVDLASISVRTLFARATEHLSANDVKLVGNVLQRTYPDGKGLGDEPWKTLFFENAKKSFPDDTEKMVEEVEKAGIDKSEYISEVLTPIILGITHNAEQGVLAQAIYDHKNFLSNIKDFYGISNLGWEEEQRLLKAGDRLLTGLSGEIFGFTYLKRAVEVYEWLRDNDIIEIGEDRQKAIETFQEYDLGRISKRARDAKIRGIARKLKII